MFNKLSAVKQSYNFLNNKIGLPDTVITYVGGRNTISMSIKIFDEQELVHVVEYDSKGLYTDQCAAATTLGNSGELHGFKC